MIRVPCLGFVFDPFAQDVIRAMAPAGYELSFAETPADMTEAMLEDADIILTVAPVTDAMMAKARKLRFIVKWGTGYEKIDVAAARARGIGVSITAGANAETIAEHAVTLMLVAMRRLVVADRALREGRWIPGELRPKSQRLFGKTVGILGFGNTGQALARQLAGFRTRTLYYRRSGPAAEDWGATYRPLDALLAESDVVSIHVPGGPANRGLIGAEAMAKMKRGAVLVNVSRGELIDEAALVAALGSGQLSAAGLDVFQEEPLRMGSPLRGLDTVVLTPHAAGSVVDDIVVMATHAFDNMRRLLAGEALRPVDLIVPASPTGRADL